MSLFPSRKMFVVCFIIILLGALIANVFLSGNAHQPSADKTTINLNSLLGDTPSDSSINNQNTGHQTFPQVTQPRDFKFPEDHLAHTTYRSEWWYFTGHLKEQGQTEFRYGFQFTIFRHALTPSSEKSANWASPQIYMGHLAITDVTKNVHSTKELFSRAGPDLAGSSTNPPKIWLKTWSIISSDDKDWLPLRIKAQAPDSNIKLDLLVDSEKPQILHGNNGYSPKGPDTASYYYSYTRLHLKGLLNHNEQSDIAVNGQGWFDHEWGSSYLTPEQTGWDWFSLQLDNGMELMLFEIRSDLAKLNTRSVTLVSSRGEKLPLSINDVSLETLQRWQSPSGKSYPAQWHLKIPRYKLDLRIKPRIANQEMSLSIMYWEGAVEISGSENGLGYVELSGY